MEAITNFTSLASAAFGFSAATVDCFLDLVELRLVRESRIRCLAKKRQRRCLALSAALGIIWWGAVDAL